MYFSLLRFGPRYLVGDMELLRPSDFLVLALLTKSAGSAAPVTSSKWSHHFSVRLSAMSKTSSLKIGPPTYKSAESCPSEKISFSAAPSTVLNNGEKSAACIARSLRRAHVGNKLVLFALHSAGRELPPIRKIGQPLDRLADPDIFV